MADNFNLRQFLTENKLTKNAKLLSEAVTLDGKPVDINSIEIDGIDTSDYPDFSDAYITYAEFEDGTPLSEDELMSLEDQNYGIVGELIFDKQLYTEGEEVEEGIHDRNILSRPLSNPAIEPLEQSPEELGRAADARSENILRATYNRQIKDPNISDEELRYILSGKGVKGFGGTPNAVNNILASRSGMEETVKENKMTQRDKYLTRLVENALGLDITEEENVDYTMGNQDDPNQLPNPAPELNIPEGDEMVEEKPLPKYENIEKLMQEIEKNTDEESHKFKIAEMKRVADGLEKKATALEEGDNAEHIDMKKLKQMKKDVMTLRKNIDKLEKVGEKKFAKKEEKAELKEGFDLRKFLVENKLTRDSRNIQESAE